MRISLGNDHFGFTMKAEVIEILNDLNCEINDHGCNSNDPVDFPDIARKVCGDIRTGKADRGIMICGTGIGASIAANKIPGIRAATVHDVHCAHQSVEHDDMNVLTMGAHIIGSWLAKDIIEAYVKAVFSSNEDFRRRVEKLNLLEIESAKEILHRINSRKMQVKL